MRRCQPPLNMLHYERKPRGDGANILHVGRDFGVDLPLGIQVRTWWCYVKYYPSRDQNACHASRLRIVSRKGENVRSCSEFKESRVVKEGAATTPSSTRSSPLRRVHSPRVCHRHNPDPWHRLPFFVYHNRLLLGLSSTRVIHIKFTNHLFHKRTNGTWLLAHL